MTSTVNQINLPVQSVLDQYLAQIEQDKRGRAAPSTSTGDELTECSRRREKEIRDKETEILRTVDFLYGNTLEGALAILDTVENAGSITHLVSIPSRRSLYLVKGSASYARSKFRGGRDKSSSDSYLCMVPRPDDDLPIYYCSCRSFLERNSSSGTGSGEGACLCKHLLAIRLSTVLGVRPTLQETMSDADFSSIVLQRISIER